ncbi:MAG: M23 family metallopeptidase [Candidatus Hydrothermarchaeales archaeon]
MLSSACIEETTTNIPEITQAPVETTIAPQTTVSPATLPLTTDSPKPKTPVLDYTNQVLGPNHGFDDYFLTLEPTLDSNEKGFIDYLSQIPKDDHIEVKLAMDEITEDGEISDTELAYVRLSAENPENLKLTRDIFRRNLTLQIEERYDSNMELVKKLFKAIQPYPDFYPSDFALDFLEKYLKNNVLDQYLEEVVKESYIDWKSESKNLENYKVLANGSQHFSKLSPNFQKILLETKWIKDGVDQSDVDYLSTIPLTFNPDDKTMDTDGGSVEDYYEVLYQGEISDPNDDNSILMDHYIEGHRFLTWPVACEGDQYITNDYDYDLRQGYERDHKGSSVSVYDGHTGIDLFVEYGAPIRAMAGGTVSQARLDDNHIDITHSDRYLSMYGHMSKIIVEKGQTVSRGDIIGYAGGTTDCKCDNPHLHFGVLDREKTYGIHSEAPIFRDEIGNLSSESLWINDNDPLCLSEDGTWKVADIK